MRFVSYGIQLYNFFQSNRRRFLYIPLGLYWLLLFILTSIPGSSMPKIIGVSDKVEHLGAYFILSLLITFTFHLQTKIKILSRKSFVFSFIIVSFYGFFDEVHQIFIPGRMFDWWDLVADMLGALLGILIVKIIIHEKSNNKNNLEQT